MTNQSSTPVIVNGAAGKMGREVIKAVANASDMTLFGASGRVAPTSMRGALSAYFTALDNKFKKTSRTFTGSHSSVGRS
ncbi:MAG: hypothetical protein F6K39_33935, partial [Okeania sp. SIO3B3]|nr:hypothetical protein [Okeania sp. SIO3B3]